MPASRAPFGVAADRVEMRAETGRAKDDRRDGGENEQRRDRIGDDAERAVGDGLELASAPIRRNR